MEKHVQPAVDRFDALSEDNKEKFYERLTAYVRFYSFISQIIPYSDKELEMLYSYGRHLISELDFGDDANPHPEKEVDLQYYRIEQVSSGAIVMEGGDALGVKSPTAVGTSNAKDEQKPLSEIIQALNDRFGTDFTEEDRLFFEQIKEKASKDDKVIQTARANNLEKFKLGIQDLIKDLMVQRMADNDGIVTRYMDDPDFQKTIFPILAKEIYNSILGAAEQK